MRRRSSLATASTVLIALPSPAACERRRGRRAARTWLTSCREWCDNRAPIVPQSAASPASAGSTSMSCHDPIARVDAVTVGIDLPTPLLLGSTEIGRREYAVVTVTTEDGLSGSSYSLTRALPLAAAVRDRPADTAAARVDRDRPPRVRRRHRHHRRRLERIELLAHPRAAARGRGSDRARAAAGRRRLGTDRGCLGSLLPRDGSRRPHRHPDAWAEPRRHRALGHQGETGGPTAVGDAGRSPTRSAGAGGRRLPTPRPQRGGDRGARGQLPPVRPPAR